MDEPCSLLESGPETQRESVVRREFSPNISVEMLGAIPSLSTNHWGFPAGGHHREVRFFSVPDSSSE